MRKTIGSLAAAFLLLHSLPALAEEKPSGSVGERTVVTATVEAVDQDTRMVTLLGTDGEKVTFKAGPQVKNLAQVKKGDKVTIATFETLAIRVAPPGEGPSAAVSESVARAPLGEKPSGTYSRTVAVSATVEALDLAKRTVTLRGPKGNAVTMKVGDEVKRLDQVKVGDLVAAEYTEVVDIAVTAP